MLKDYEREKAKEYANSIDWKEVNQKIGDLISSDKPFSIIRTRAEDETVFKVLKNKTLDGRDYRLLFINSGVYPNRNMKVIKEYANEYIESYKNADIFTYHFMNPYHLYEYWIKTYNPNVIKGHSRNSSFPFKHPDPWTKHLAGKKVLIVTPFAKTVEKQYTTKDLRLPKFDIVTYKCVQSIAGNKVHSSWSESLRIMKEDIAKIEFDVALLGCGAYTAPLCTHVKKLGKGAIQMGGGINKLFYISCGRFPGQGYPWAKCLPEEKPKNFKQVENGCYW